MPCRWKHFMMFWHWILIRYIRILLSGVVKEFVVIWRKWRSWRGIVRRERRQKRIWRWSREMRKEERTRVGNKPKSRFIFHKRDCDHESDWKRDVANQLTFWQGMCWWFYSYLERASGWRWTYCWWWVREGHAILLYSAGKRKGILGCWVVCICLCFFGLSGETNKWNLWQKCVVFWPHSMLSFLYLICFLRRETASRYTLPFLPDAFSLWGLPSWDWFLSRSSVNNYNWKQFAKRNDQYVKLVTILKALQRRWNAVFTFFLRTGSKSPSSPQLVEVSLRCGFYPIEQYYCLFSGDFVLIREKWLFFWTQNLQMKIRQDRWSRWHNIEKRWVACGDCFSEHFYAVLPGRYELCSLFCHLIARIRSAWKERTHLSGLRCQIHRCVYYFHNDYFHCRYIEYDDETRPREKIEEEFELEDPLNYLKGLTVRDFEDLLEDIKVHLYFCCSSLSVLNCGSELSLVCGQLGCIALQ